MTVRSNIMMNKEKTMIKVFFKEWRNDEVRSSNPSTLTHVANIHLDTDHLDPAPSTEAILEMAWRLTQNIEGSWSRGPLFETGEENYDYDPRIEVVASLRVDANGKTWGHRSSMVLDEFELNGETYVCKTSGFELKSKKAA